MRSSLCSKVEEHILFTTSWSECRHGHNCQLEIHIFLSSCSNSHLERYVPEIYRPWLTAEYMEIIFLLYTHFTIYSAVNQGLLQLKGVQEDYMCAWYCFSSTHKLIVPFETAHLFSTTIWVETYSKSSSDVAWSHIFQLWKWSSHSLPSPSYTDMGVFDHLTFDLERSFRKC